jgi:hypothetical protein
MSDASKEGPPLPDRPDDRHPDRLRHPVRAGRLADQAPGLEGRPAGPDRGAEDRARPAAGHVLAAPPRARTSPGPGSRSTCAADRPRPCRWSTASATATSSGAPRPSAGPRGRPYGAILLDLGVVKALTGQVDARAGRPGRPAQVVGVLMAIKQLGGDRAARSLKRFAADKPAPYILMVEPRPPFRRRHPRAAAGRNFQSAPGIRADVVRSCRNPAVYLCRHALAEDEILMRYVSTRGESPSIGFLDAVLAGLAPDGGLYVPERWPTFTPEEIAAFAGQPYAQVAATVIGKFVGDDLPAEDLREMCEEAYASFAHAAVVAAEAAGPRPLPAGAVPRPDPGVQGRGDAAAGAAVRLRAVAPVADHDHHLRHLGRHRRRGRRGLPRPLPTPASSRSSRKAGSARSSAGS